MKCLFSCKVTYDLPQGTGRWTCTRQCRSYTVGAVPGCPVCPPRSEGLPPPGPLACRPFHGGVPSQWEASSTVPGPGHRNSEYCASSARQVYINDYVKTNGEYYSLRNKRCHCQ